MEYSYKIIDAHCDTIGEMYKKAELIKNDGHLDIERMKMYKNYLQIFAVWADANEGIKKQKQRHDEIINRFYEQTNINSDSVVHVKNFAQINDAWVSDKVALILGIEGADYVKTLEDVDDLYNSGVRCMTLTWNGSNYIASGVGDDTASFGLTDFGKKVVYKMNELGMLIDVSHISERAFYDVIEATKAPIAASHSNSKSVCAHRRNLTDKQFLEICKNGGVVGVNYYPEFISGKRRVNIDDVILHIEHFCALGGENHIGLGGDFDGVDALPSDLRGVQDVYKLLDRLLKLNYSEVVVEKIANKNFMRLFESVLK